MDYDRANYDGKQLALKPMYKTVLDHQSMYKNPTPIPSERPTRGILTKTQETTEPLSNNQPSSPKAASDQPAPAHSK
jgi:hypothetical protein